MRYSRLVAGLLVALGATQCLAETPDWSQNQPQAMSILQRTRLMAGPNWWNRLPRSSRGPAGSKNPGRPRQ